MNRIVILILVLSLLAVPVAADGWSSTIYQSGINVLDYATPNGGDSYTVYYTSGDEISFQNSTRHYLSYFDIVLTMNAGSISSATLNNKNLTIIDYGNRVYRLYGQFDRSTYGTFNLVLNTTASANITFLSFDAYANYSSPAGLTGQFTWERFTNTTEQGTREQSAFRDTVFIVKPEYASPIYGTNTIPWKVFLTADDWNKYDYISFLVSTDMAIDSIVVSSDMGTLPYTVSDVTMGNDNTDLGHKMFSVVVDIRSYPRGSATPPTLTINLSQDYQYAGSFYLYEVLGYIDYDYEEPDVYWLRRLFHYSNNWWSWLIENLTSLGTSVSNGFSNIVSTLGSVRDSLYTRLGNIFDAINSNFTDLKDYLTPKFTQIGTWITNMRDSLYSRLGSILDVLKSDSDENKDAADDFNSSVETQADQLQDISDTMNSVERPDISNVSLDVSSMVDSSSVNLFTAGISSVLGTDFFVRLLVMALTFALIGFVLYGKR